MDLHLLSLPGVSGAEYVLAAARAILAQAAPSQHKPRVAYLPAASLHHRWIRETRAYFHELASISVIDMDRHSLEQIQAILDRSDLLYIPGGNTYWLAHQLNRACRRDGAGAAVFDRAEDESEAVDDQEQELEDIMEAATALIGTQPLVEMGGEDSLMAELRRRALAGLPVVGFSAGAVLCGPDILTTNDINACGCTCFNGLGLTPFYLNMHYPQDPQAALARQERLQEFLHFHPRATILAMQDDAYVRVADGEVHVIHGGVWKIEHGQEASLVSE